MESSGLWELASPITNTQAFAQGSKIRELNRLLDAYGGKNWKSAKAMRPFAFAIPVSCCMQNCTGTKHMVLEKLN